MCCIFFFGKFNGCIVGIMDFYVIGGGKFVSIDGLDSYFFYGLNCGEYL